MSDHTIDELLEMSVDDQKDELKNLSKSELKELRQQEERTTAKNRIDRQLRKIGKTKEEKSNSKSKVEQQSQPDDERLATLEAKVDYLIEKCKTTSQQGFENYED